MGLQQQQHQQIRAGHAGSTADSTVLTLGMSRLALYDTVRVLAMVLVDTSPLAGLRLLQSFPNHMLPMQLGMLSA